MRILAGILSLLFLGVFGRAEESFQRLHTFPPLYMPGSMLVRGPDGNFYGTGFDDNGLGDTCGGILFRLSGTGEYTPLRRFPLVSDDKPLLGNGAYLAEDFVLGPDGTIYGSTLGGGAYGRGVIFSLTPTGVFSILHEFVSSVGTTPSLKFRDGNGDLYGIRTSPDGTEDWLFRLSAAGEMSVIHTFPSRWSALVQRPGTNYYYPNGIGSLFRGSDGKVYGVSQRGGGQVEYAGSIFRIEDDNSLTVVMSADADRLSPTRLIEGPDGTFYCLCASYYGDVGGAILRVTQDGTSTILKQFTDPAEGVMPTQVVLAEDGNLYGTTSYGGAIEDGSSGLGTYFKLTDGGQFSVLQVLDKTGGGLNWRLAKGNDGYVYGVTAISWDAGMARASADPQRYVSTREPVRAPRRSNGFFRTKLDGVLAENQLPRAKSNVRVIGWKPGVPPKSITIPVLANDRDPDRDSLTIAEISNPQFGTAVIREDGRAIVYTPGTSPKTDTFTYMCSDGKGGASRGQVLVRRRASGMFTAGLRDDQDKQVGTVLITMNALGSFRAQVSIAGTRKSFRGALGTDDSYKTVIPLKDGRYAALRFALNPDGTQTLDGDVSIGTDAPISFLAK